MYYAHPLISYPPFPPCPSPSFSERGPSQSPVSERKSKKRSGCNDILLTVLTSLYGALHLAAALLALFLIQVKYWQHSRLNSVNWCLFVSVFWKGANYRRSGTLSVRFCWFPRQWTGPRCCLVQISPLPPASPHLPSLHNNLWLHLSLCESHQCRGDGGYLPISDNCKELLPDILQWAGGICGGLQNIFQYFSARENHPQLQEQHQDQRRAVSSQEKQPAFSREEFTRSEPTGSSCLTTIILVFIIMALLFDTLWQQINDISTHWHLLLHIL